MRANAAPHSRGDTRRAAGMRRRGAVYTGPMHSAIKPEIAFIGGGNMASALIGGHGVEAMRERSPQLAWGEEGAVGVDEVQPVVDARCRCRAASRVA